MNTNKTVEIILLSSEDEAKINDLFIGGINRDLVVFNETFVSDYNNDTFFKEGPSAWLKHHIYILSDDEIKEGDWFLNGMNNLSLAVKETFIGDWFLITSKKCRKIIASTNHLKNGNKVLPNISKSFIDEFANKYNKGQIIKEINVEYYRRGLNSEGIDADLTGGILVHKNDYYEPRINTDNNIIINSFVINNSKKYWSKEEVENLLHAMYSDLTTEETYNGTFYDEWVKKHL